MYAALSGFPFLLAAADFVLYRNQSLFSAAKTCGSFPFFAKLLLPLDDNFLAS